MRRALIALGLATALAGCGQRQGPPTLEPPRAPIKPTRLAPPAAWATDFARVKGDANPCTAQAANKPFPAGKTRLTIGAGGASGAYYPIAAAIARALTATLPNSEATIDPTGGSAVNARLVKGAGADLGLSLSDTAFDASHGIGLFKDEGRMPLCALANLYPSYLHVVARGGVGIGDVSAMRGARVSVGPAGSAAEVAADRLLTVAGLDPATDITRLNLGTDESAAQLAAGTLDAFFAFGSAPDPAIAGLLARNPGTVRLIPTGEYAAALRERFGPAYAAAVLPGGTYPGVAADVPGIAAGTLLLVNANMNEQLAHAIVKAMFEQADALRAARPELAGLTPATAAAGSSIPYHPGAQRYYAEVGAAR